MKKINLNFLLMFICLGTSLVFANENPKQQLTSQTKTIEDPILVGELKLSEIEELGWFIENYNAYQPDMNVVKSIARKIMDKNIRIKIYFGTWCPDSQYEVPRLIKLLKSFDFDIEKVTLVGLDRDKKIPNVTEKQAAQLDIKMIPTFVFFEDDKEMNRFVEFARETLERDVLSILSNEDYQHSYK